MPQRPSIAAVDSGPLIALFDKRDRRHAGLRAFLRDHPALALVTVWPVLAEVCAVLLARVHRQAELDFISWVGRGAVGVLDLEPGSLVRVHARMVRYRDLPLDFAAASLAELLEQERIDSLLSLDSDFDVYRSPSRRPLVNLLATISWRRMRT
jgi:predicted nucleic acid-binding protein